MADRLRLLHRNSARGYTDRSTQAMRSGSELEPEAIAADVQERFSAEARHRYAILRAEEIARRETRSRVNRLRQLEAEARKKSIDAHRHLVEIDRQIGLIQQRVHPAS